MKTAAFVLGRHSQLPEDAAAHLGQFDMVVWSNRTHYEKPGLIEATRLSNRRAKHFMFFSWMNMIDKPTVQAMGAAGQQDLFDYRFAWAMHFGRQLIYDDNGDPVSSWPGLVTPKIDSPDVGRFFAKTVVQTLREVEASEGVAVAPFIDMTIDAAYGLPHLTPYISGPAVTSVLWDLLSRLSMAFPGLPVLGNGTSHHYAALSGREWENFDPARHDPQTDIGRYLGDDTCGVVHSSDDKANKVAALNECQNNPCLYHHHTATWNDATNWERLPEWDD